MVTISWVPPKSLLLSTPIWSKYGPQRVPSIWVSHKKCEKVASMRTYNPTRALEANSLLPTKRTARNHINSE